MEAKQKRIQTKKQDQEKREHNEENAESASIMQPGCSGYKTTQSFGKALRRVEKHLPEKQIRKELIAFCLKVKK